MSGTVRSQVVLGRPEVKALYNRALTARNAGRWNEVVSQG